MAKSTGTNRKKLFDKVSENCSGPCVGSGIGYQVVHRRCPKTGDPKTLANVREQAKNNAYNKAQEMCRKGGPDCVCHGEHQALIPEQCVSIKDADGKDACLYFAAYAYVGKCVYLL